MNATPTAVAAPATDGRRSDLDALRGAAMTLGIVLHASLAYFPFPWPVQDPRQQAWFGLLFAAIHSFRMPLFFLLSGFFTMLVLRRRGLRSLLEQRVLRILLPLLLGTVTILPLNRAVTTWAIDRSTTDARDPLMEAIRASDVAAVRAALVLPPSAAMSRISPLELAAMVGDPEVVAVLLDAGAPPDARTSDGGTPLHAAAFMGRADVAELLLARGADASARNAAGRSPLEATTTPIDWPIVAGTFQRMPEPDVADVAGGRLRVRHMLAARGAALPAAGGLAAIVGDYWSALGSPALAVRIGDRSWQPFSTDVFHHLWFLWYLCWLVAAFSVASVAGFAPTGRHRWWLVPASCVPFILTAMPFGTDTGPGLVPPPHLLLYYGCFFWFGAATYAAEGTGTSLGRHWKVVLPAALLVLFPLALATIGRRPLATIIQPALAWSASIGCIGLFHRFLSRPSAVVRWLADAAYWMYVAHVPVVIVCQSLVQDLPWPAPVKFLVVITVTVAVLVVTYRWCVRFTPIGWLLNGPRSRGIAA